MRTIVHILLGVVLVGVSATSSSASGPPVDEREAKAVLLLHLTQFVSWPESPPQSEFRIGILGPDPFGGVLETVFRSERVGPYPIVIERATAANALRDCQLVYVSARARESPARIQSAFRGRSILTVGERDNFIHTGGVLQFARTPARNLRLSINLDNARSAGLRISAQLLRVSEVHQASAQ